MAQRRPLRFLMQLCCVFLLLFAQQAALTHAVWHAHQQFPVEHQHAVFADTAHHGDLDGAGGVCAFDAALGQMLGAAPCGPPRTVAKVTAGDALAAGYCSVATTEFLAPLSRGPPALPMT